MTYAKGCQWCVRHVLVFPEKGGNWPGSLAGRLGFSKQTTKFSYWIFFFRPKSKLWITRSSLFTWCNNIVALSLLMKPHKEACFRYISHWLGARPPVLPHSHSPCHVLASWVLQLNGLFSLPAVLCLLASYLSCILYRNSSEHWQIFLESVAYISTSSMSWE